MAKIFSSDEKPQALPHRLQYSFKEAAYMLSISTNTGNEQVKRWCDELCIPYFKMNENPDKGKNYITHSNLVRLAKAKRHYHTSWYEGDDPDIQARIWDDEIGAYVWWNGDEIIDSSYQWKKENPIRKKVFHSDIGHFVWYFEGEIDDPYYLIKKQHPQKFVQVSE